MPEMRSVTQQIDGLETVAKLVPAARLELGLGDVPALRLGRREIVFAVGGYDLWIEGQLHEPDLTAEDAAARLKGDE